MSFVGPKMDSWGCAACFHHIKIDEIDYCNYAEKNIDLLPVCPIGLSKKKPE
jgi:hypothetical protein